MARERMVTRTVMQTTYEVMTLNAETADVAIKEFVLGGTYDKTQDALKVLKKLYETDVEKLVVIKGSTTSEILYGMPESVFIKYAEILPPRKINEKEEENG